MLRSRPALGARALSATVALLSLLAALAAPPGATDNGPVADRERIITSLAQFLSIATERLELGSVRFEEHCSWRHRPFYSCRCTVRSDDDNPIGWVWAELEVENYAVAGVQWLGQPLDAVRETATEFAARHFAGWSDDMVLHEHHSPERQTVSFSWREKRDGAWTGTYVVARFNLSFPGWPCSYSGYVATPRARDEVTVSKDEAVEKAEQQGLRRGLKNARVREAELYLDSHLRPFPHWVITLLMDDPAGPQQAPVPVEVLVHGVTGEIVQP